VTEIGEAMRARQQIRFKSAENYNPAP